MTYLKKHLCILPLAIVYGGTLTTIWALFYWLIDQEFPIWYVFWAATGGSWMTFTSK